jgi:hypothetical protein
MQMFGVGSIQDQQHTMFANGKGSLGDYMCITLPDRLTFPSPFADPIVRCVSISPGPLNGEGKGWSAAGNH